MTEWNPVEGLKELTWSELRRGDDVVQQSHTVPNRFTRIVNAEPDVLHALCRYFLIDRKVDEPTNRGDVVAIYLRDDSREALVESYIRVRSKFQDENLNDDEAWTSVRNNVSIPWEIIVRKSRENSNYRLRTYEATYVEVV